MVTQLRALTADELLAMPEDGVRRELVEGELREMVPAGGDHGEIGMRLGWRLAQFVETGNLGVVYSSDTGFRLSRDPDTVRCPDVGFIARERYARFRGVVDRAPDLAVEVVSPNDTYSDVRSKVHQYLDAGTRMVVVIDPPTQTVDLYRSRTDHRELTKDDLLDGEDVVPGWKLPVRDIFI